MKVLGAAVLGLEAFAVLLAIPVALALTDARAVLAWLLVGIAALAVTAAALLRRRTSIAVALGWAVQGALLSTALLAPILAVVTVVFAALWWAALHFGTEVDRVRGQ